ncbi:MAG: DUF1614 domain-containing protein [Euryarchaeota archaeon]|nr:DUF1614 domain-containing protein [Euryarchaeota archaeon]
MVLLEALVIALPWVPVLALAYGLLPLLVHPRDDGRLVDEPGWGRDSAAVALVLLPTYSLAAGWLSVPVWPVAGTWLAFSVAGAVLPLGVAFSLARRRGVLVPGLLGALPVAVIMHYVTRFEPGLGVTGEALHVVLLPLLVLLVGLFGGVRPDRLFATAMLAGPLGVLVGADLLRTDLLVGTHHLVVFGGGGLRDLVVVAFLVPAAVDAVRTRHREEHRHGRAVVWSRSGLPAGRASGGPLGLRLGAASVDLTVGGLLFVAWWWIDLTWGLGGHPHVMLWLAVQAPFVATWAWETVAGRSLGKRLFGLVVREDATGGPASVSASWARGAFRWLDALLLFGPMWRTGKRPGDHAAMTQVDPET